MSSTATEVTTSPSASSSSTPDKKYLYLAGVHVTHSIALPMHNHIAKSLSLPWTFINQECPTINDVVSLFRAPTFAGGVVTMPYKQAIIPFLDELDPLVTQIGACNNVYLTPEDKLRGTNTDWRGIKGCLLSGTTRGENEGRGKSALIIGAGGASRAAIYALFAELECGEIYVVNRDRGEVEDLLKDAQAYATSEKDRQLRIRHVTSVGMAEELSAPFYVVGTVPDFEAKTEEELNARAILETFLRKEEKGMLLDMCFKPRNTRILRMGRENGWKAVEGTGVIGYQIEEQWRLWAGVGQDGRKAVPKEEAWDVLRKAAEESTAINF
ncbi:shikimate [Leptodontidium sp. 2 PMI_412]|nr:shikimate [Leptodontidium sp. 2 PMI_412]